MRLCTVVKVHADSPEDAIEQVSSLLTHDGEYCGYQGCSPFDYLDEDATAISEDVSNEKQFAALRQVELKRYKEQLEVAEGEVDDNAKGFYLRMAGESLSEDMFWSVQRLAYYMEDSEGENTYYVDTDRHC